MNTGIVLHAVAVNRNGWVTPEPENCGETEDKRDAT